MWTPQAHFERIGRDMFYDQYGIVPSIPPASPCLNTTSPLSDRNQCAVCKTQQKVTACTGCRVLHYCGTARQKTHWPGHKRVCKAIKTSTEQVWMAMADIKRGLDAAGGDVRSYFASNPPEAEAHIHFRYILGRNLTKAGTKASVEEGLRSSLEVDKLCASKREINDTAGDFIPGLYLRLGREKKCLAFIKGKCKGDLDAIYSWNDHTAPRPQANAETLSLAHASMLCVFKLRVLQDLWDLHAADFALGNKLPAKLFNECRSYLVGEATKTDVNIMRAIDKREDLLREIDVIEENLLDLRAYIDAFGAAKLEKYKKMQPAYEPELPITEALAQTYDAWAETPGAYVMFQEICTRETRESENEDDD